ncbi:ubiquitin-conjugating enzyme/RWD-like protein [Limtongia smithiae]|uniref:ubiquitin-conjugating enzyme/RWD-like protein n=1 Tax=Limtongia smithiae TaxID=1125753 RepID=UPI0034CD2161
MVSQQAMRRIGREFTDITAHPSPHYTAAPRSDEDIFNWEIVLFGPKDTPYEGGTFKLDLKLPQGYPFNPPILVFTTKIFHPNVLPDGSICIPLLKTDQWKPACKITTIIDIAYGLLADPDEAEALEGDAAEMFRTDPSKYKKIAKDWTKSYAK